MHKCLPARRLPRSAPARSPDLSPPGKIATKLTVRARLLYFLTIALAFRHRFISVIAIRSEQSRLSLPHCGGNCFDLISGHFGIKGDRQGLLSGSLGLGKGSRAVSKISIGLNLMER